MAFVEGTHGRNIAHAEPVALLPGPNQRAELGALAHDERCLPLPLGPVLANRFCHVGLARRADRLDGGRQFVPCRLPIVDVNIQTGSWTALTNNVIQS